MSNVLRKGAEFLAPIRNLAKKELHTSGEPKHLKLVVVYGDQPSDQFDRSFLRAIRKEGFSVTYRCSNGLMKDFRNELELVTEELDDLDKYAIVSFSKAASLTLEACEKPLPNLQAVVVYYPQYLPNRLPSSLPFPLTFHVAGSQDFVPSCPHFVYPYSSAGFAEVNNKHYDHVDAGLSWARTLATLRRGLKVHNDIEAVWNKHTQMKLIERDIRGAVGTLDDSSIVNYSPVAIYEEGIGPVGRFYSEAFGAKDKLASFKMRLISRTVGSDHIVDENFISFAHTREVPWLLPNVPPTGNVIEIALVCVVKIRGGRVLQENVYWDQASVLVQAGLLDPKYIPPSFMATAANAGVEKAASALQSLPVTGAESAMKLLHGPSWTPSVTVPPDVKKT